MAKRAKGTSEPGTITLQTAAKLLMVSNQLVLNLVKEGFIERNAFGSYQTVSVVQGYIKYLNVKLERKNANAAASRLSDRKAALVDVQLAERSGKLRADLMEEALSLIDIAIGGLRADLMSVPAQVTADLNIRKKIEIAIDNALAAGSDRAGREASGVEANSSAVEADEEDDA